MKSRFAATDFAIAILAIGLSSAPGCLAQTPDAQPAAAPAQTAVSFNPEMGDQAKPGPALTIRDQKVLESFEPPVDAEYTLGAGDEVTIDFPTQPELNVKTTPIGPDGRITIKYAGNVRIADLTREAAAQAIVAALSKYYTDLSPTISIDKYTANRVRVIGYVQHPGEIPFEGTPTLLDAIGRAGLISPTVTKEGVSTNIGPGIPETCTVYRGNDTAVRVQLRELLVSGSTLADMRLRRNDIVYVPQPKELFVSVMGQVARPGTVPLTPESTLTSVLAQAGCCADNAGFNPKIHIIQSSTNKDFQVSYKEILTLPGQKEFALHSGDVIYVTTSAFSKFGIVIAKISPVSTMLSLAAVGGAL